MTRLISPEETAMAERGGAICRLCPTTGHRARDRRHEPP